MFGSLIPGAAGGPPPPDQYVAGMNSSEPWRFEMYNFAIGFAVGAFIVICLWVAIWNFGKIRATFCCECLGICDDPERPRPLPPQDSSEDE